MRRILVILGLFVLLMNARHTGFELPPSAAAPIEVHARPLNIPLEPSDLRVLGGLRFAGAWELSSSHPSFGGISALLPRGDGGLIAISDRGETFLFDPRRRRDTGAMIAGLPNWRKDKVLAGWKLDSEAAQSDPLTGRSWVSFEIMMRVCRYAPALARAESCASPPALAKWDITGAAEAMVRFADGRFLLFSETFPARGGALEALLFASDPSEEDAPPPAVLGYLPPTGFRPTDALDLGQGQVLVLNRRVTLAQGFAAVLAIVDVSKAAPGALLVARPVARFEPPVPSDNFEAMALVWEKGEPMLWLASDDNHFFLQRSLLYKFRVPQDWVTPRE